MTKINNLRQAFRKINHALQGLHGQEIRERNKTITALIIINERLADETETLLRNFINTKKENYVSNKEQSID